MKRKLFKRSLLILTVLIVVSSGAFAWKLYSAAAKITGDSNPIKLASSFVPSSLSETNGRVNVLLAGYSADDPGHQGADLTDSIMVLSINTQAKTAVIISIPRDMYVDIPGYGYQKINAAYEDGGMSLLQQVISQDFGIQTNYYGLLDYTALEDAVNDVGDVTVTINSPDSRGLYDPNTNLSLPNGQVTLNGQQALDLARARGDGTGSYGFPDGDFDRTMYQQALLIALKNKASQASVIANPLKVASLISDIGNNFKTNMTIGQMETLYSDTKSISNSNITDVTLNNVNGQSLLTNYITSSGQDALIPAAGLDDYSAIQSTIQSLLSTSTN